MTLRRVSLVLVAACVLPSVAHAGAKAGDAEPTAPHLVRVGHEVCLVYADADGTSMARCRPKGGTWAQARPPRKATPAMSKQTSWLSMPLPSRQPVRASSCARSGERSLFGVGVLSLGIGIPVSGISAGWPCTDFVCPGVRWSLAFGLVTALVGVALVNVDAMVRQAMRTDEYHDHVTAPAAAVSARRWSRHSERVVHDAGLLTLDGGVLLGFLGEAFSYNCNPSEAWCAVGLGAGTAGLVVAGIGTVLLVIDAVLRVAGPPDAPSSASSPDR